MVALPEIIIATIIGNTLHDPSQVNVQRIVPLIWHVGVAIPLFRERERERRMDLSSSETGEKHWFDGNHKP